MQSPDEIRAERLYSNTRLTLAEKKFLRRLTEEARANGEPEATDRLLRLFDTAFLEHRAA